VHALAAAYNRAAAGNVARGVRQLMTHKIGREDVYETWDRCRNVTRCEGILTRDGASWRIAGGPPSLSGWLYGAASMVLALRAYIEGWKDARGIADESIR
jgi:hypothetical protein